MWTDILLFIAVLRGNFGVKQTDKLNQANIYMLEYIVETALAEFDEKSADKIKLQLAKGLNIHNEYIFLLYQSMHIEFVSDKSKKLRFHNIPKLINRHFSEGSQGYNEIISAFNNIANEEKCEITDLEFQEFPEIVW